MKKFILLFFVLVVLIVCGFILSGIFIKKEMLLMFDCVYQDVFDKVVLLWICGVFVEGFVFFQVGFFEKKFLVIMIIVVVIVDVCVKMLFYFVIMVFDLFFQYQKFIEIEELVKNIIDIDMVCEIVFLMMLFGICIVCIMISLSGGQYVLLVMDEMMYKVNQEKVFVVLKDVDVEIK